MATSHLFCHMDWGPRNRPDLWAIWTGTGQQQCQNCPRLVETGFPWRSHKSSKKHVMAGDACITIPFESETGCIAP